MSIYEISGCNDLIRMKISIDWNNPETKKHIIDFSTDIANVPDDASMSTHLDFFLNNLATSIYMANRESKYPLYPEELGERVFGSLCFKSALQKIIKIESFDDNTEETNWKITERPTVRIHDYREGINMLCRALKIAKRRANGERFMPWSVWLVIGKAIEELQKRNKDDALFFIQNLRKCFSQKILNEALFCMVLDRQTVWSYRRALHHRAMLEAINPDTEESFIGMRRIHNLVWKSVFGECYHGETRPMKGRVRGIPDKREDAYGKDSFLAYLQIALSDYIETNAKGCLL